MNFLTRIRAQLSASKNAQDKAVADPYWRGVELLASGEEPAPHSQELINAMLELGKDADELERDVSLVTDLRLQLEAVGRGDELEKQAPAVARDVANKVAQAEELEGQAKKLRHEASQKKQEHQAARENIAKADLLVKNLRRELAERGHTESKELRREGA